MFLTAVLRPDAESVPPSGPAIGHTLSIGRSILHGGSPMNKEKNRLIAVVAVIVVVVAIIAAALVLTGGDDRGGDDGSEDVLFDLTVSSNDGGIVTPAGTTELAEGTTQTITITPDSGYKVSDVLLDGESVGAVTSLEVVMDGDHTVEVVFGPETEPAPVEHTITASAGAGGRISPSGEVKVADGADQKFTFTANGSYRVSQVTVDGKAVTVTGNSYTFEDVSGDHTISVTFRYVGGGGGGGTTPSVTLTGISVTAQPDRTSYLAGEIFDKTGMVITASYSNGSTKTVDDYTCSPDGKLTVDVERITVTYQGKTTTVDITVIAAESEILKIEVTMPPDKTHYFDDQVFDDIGMEVSAVYDGDVKIPLDSSMYEASEDVGTGETRTVTVTLLEDGSKTTTLTISRNNTIMDVEELKHFRDNVNKGITYSGETVSLGADIDLKNESWTPIGNKNDIEKIYNPFEGIFDGQNHKISNLKIDEPQTSSVGLFGYTTDGEIKKLVVENAVVTGYLEVGVVAGTPYTSKYSNITVTGHVEVNGYAYVGGVGGKNVYADWNNVKVEVDESSYVKADSENNRTYVGGIIGFMGEGNHTMTNLTSDIDVTGSTCDVGGIVGIAHYGNTFINCFSSGNVTIVNAMDEGDQLEIGGIAGVWMNHDSGSVSFINCSYKGELSSSLKGVPVDDGSYPYGGLIGYKYYRDSNSGELIIEMEGVKNAVYVGIADELLAVGNELSKNQSDYKDKTIILMNDLDMTGKEWPVINLNSAVGSLAFKGLGDGITISNLNLGNGNNDTTGNIGFIAYTGSMKSLIIEKISFDSLDTGTVADSGTNAVGALIGYAGTSESITISSCNVLNSTISGGHWAGGFVGYAAGYSTQSDGPVFEVLTIENCMIENSTVSSIGSAGGLIGHATGDAWTRDEFKECTVKDCIITSTGKDTDKAGSLMGTVGAGQSMFGKDGGVFVTSCTVEGCEVKSNNTDIDRIYGRQGSTGGVLCVDGAYVAFENTGLEDMIASGNDVYLPSGEYDLPTNLGDGFSISGQSAKTTILNIPQTLLSTKSATFENVTLKIANGNYQGFNSSDSIIFKDCVLDGQFFLYGPKVEFHNCTFEQTYSDSYNIWTYAATNVLFSECMFNCAGKAVLVYNEGGESGDIEIEFIKCTMNATSPASGKAAIEVDASLFKHSCTVVIDDDTAEAVTGFGTGSNSGNSVWNNKNDPTVDGVTLTITVGGEVVLTKTKAA